jgi:hypothetical protein
VASRLNRPPRPRRPDARHAHPTVRDAEEVSRAGRVHARTDRGLELAHLGVAAVVSITEWRSKGRSSDPNRFAMAGSAGRARVHCDPPAQTRDDELAGHTHGPAAIMDQPPRATRRRAIRAAGRGRYRERRGPGERGGQRRSRGNRGLVGRDGGRSERTRPPDGPEAPEAPEGRQLAAIAITNLWETGRSGRSGSTRRRTSLPRGDHRAARPSPHRVCRVARQRSIDLGCADQ